MSEAYRGSGAALERIAALEEENAALRQRLEALETAIRQDERHVLLRRAEKERDQLKEQLSAYRVRRDAEEADAIARGVKAALSEAESVTAAARDEALRARADEGAVRRRVRELEENAVDRDAVLAVVAERDALLAEVTALRPNARGENELVYVRRLVEERDELLAEVRKLRGVR
jgi:hypothetical protein